AFQTANLGEVVQRVHVTKRAALRKVQRGYSYAQGFTESVSRIESNFRVRLLRLGVRQRVQEEFGDRRWRPSIAPAPGAVLRSEARRGKRQRDRRTGSRK